MQDTKRDGKEEGWKGGKVESWKVGKWERWKIGRLESGKVGKLEAWKGIRSRAARFQIGRYYRMIFVFSSLRSHEMGSIILYHGSQPVDAQNRVEEIYDK